MGKISSEAKKLMAVTKKSLALAIEQCRVGKFLGDIGYVISRYVKRHGFEVARGLTGHGIGRALHEEPSVFNSGQKGKGPPLAAGLVIAIEPMVCSGRGEIIQLADESYATKDGSLSAHFEHTVAITANGPMVLTSSMDV